MFDLIIPELSHFALIIAAVLSLMLAVWPSLGYAIGNDTYMDSAKGLAIGQSFFLMLSFFGLMLSFYANDFSVLYVANNSHTDLALGYRLCALWGAHEGSLMLWVTLLGLWTLCVTLCSKSLDRPFRSIMLSVLGAISFGFCLFILFTSNPFLRLLPEYPLQGADLNPLLQDKGFIVHPPLLYAGYVGLAVPFAFSMAALLTQSLSTALLGWLRHSILISWAFLTLGIVSGSWWAYYELGWGGWWFWDPVENASLMPWLMATALLHSALVSQQRGLFSAWTLLLAIIAFSLSLMGTFLVRSGVLTSVHAFASDPERGLFVLIFLSLVIGFALIVFALKGQGVQIKRTFEMDLNSVAYAGTSKESFLLFNNILLTLCMSTVFVGTLYPLVIEALGLPPISVGPPFFNKVFIPLMVPVIFSMVLGTHANWVIALKPASQRLLRGLFVTSIVLGLGIGWVWKGHSIGLFMLGVSCCIWLILGTLLSLYFRTAASGFKSLTPSYLGMVIAHVGLGLSIFGISCTSNFDVEKDVSIALNESIQVGEYGFTLQSLSPLQGGNYNGTQAKFDIVQYQKEETAGLVQKHLGTLYPEKRFFIARNMPMSEAAILPLLTKDIYIALGEELAPDTWSARLYIKPFVRFMWFGGILMALGAALSVLSRFYTTRRNLKNLSSCEEMK